MALGKPRKRTIAQRTLRRASPIRTNQCVGGRPLKDPLDQRKPRTSALCQGTGPYVNSLSSHYLSQPTGSTERSEETPVSPGPDERSGEAWAVAKNQRRNFWHWPHSMLLVPRFFISRSFISASRRLILQPETCRRRLGLRWRQ